MFPSIAGLERRLQMIVLSKLFTAHPRAAGEGYLEHMAFALGFSGRLFRAAFAALIHGFVPGLCETTASRTVLSMNDELRDRRAKLAVNPVAASVYSQS
jgi:hypothetical protein